MCLLLLPDVSTKGVYSDFNYQLSRMDQLLGCVSDRSCARLVLRPGRLLQALARPLEGMAGLQISQPVDCAACGSVFGAYPGILQGQGSALFIRATAQGLSEPLRLYIPGSRV
jgi:hypothetical protein